MGAAALGPALGRELSAPSWMGGEASPEHVRGHSEQGLDPVVMLSSSVLTAVCYCYC